MESTQCRWSEMNRFFESLVCGCKIAPWMVLLLCAVRRCFCIAKNEYEEDSSIYVFACKFFLVDDFIVWHKTNTIPGIVFANIFRWKTIIANFGPKNRFIHFCMRHVHLIVGLLLWRFSLFRYWTSFHFDFFPSFFLLIFLLLTNVLFHCFFAQILLR